MATYEASDIHYALQPMLVYILTGSPFFSSLIKEIKVGSPF